MGSFKQRFQQITNLAPTAAWQDRQQPCTWTKSMASEGFSSSLGRGDSVQQGMTDEADLATRPGIERSLERKDHCDSIAAPDQLADTPPPPSPDLRQYIIKDRDACPVCDTGQDQIKLGIVNKYKQ